MALRQGDEWYTSFRFTENGDAKVRRIHRMEIQANDGYLYVLEGKQLPDVIETHTGQGHRDKHLATILLNRKNFPPLSKGRMKGWPNVRDALHLTMGLAFFILLFRIVSTLAEATR